LFHEGGDSLAVPEKIRGKEEEGKGRNLSFFHGLSFSAIQT
jgi:hypothetical protein